MDFSTTMRRLRRSIASFSVLAIVASLSIVSAVSAFSDVPESAPYASYVSELLDLGIISNNATFRPADKLSRAEAAKIAVKAYGVEDADLSTKTGTFSDVPATLWNGMALKYIETAAELKIVNGDAGKKTFRPNDDVTRAELAAILVRAYDLVEDTAGGPHFSDVTSAFWGYNVVETAYNWSVVNGYGDGTFKPNAKVIRQDMAAMVSRANAGEKRTPGGTTPPVAGTVSVTAGVMAPTMNLPKGASLVKVGEFNFTAGSDADATIKSVVVKRTGPGVVADIANAYLYDGSTRLTSGRTFNASTNDATFTVSVPVTKGTTKTLGLYVSVYASATSSDQHAFSLASTSSVVVLGGTVGGSFPISTNLHTIGGTGLGTVTATKTGSISSPKVGDVGAKLTEITLAASTEDAYVSQLVLTQGGTVANAALGNFVLKQAGAPVATGTSVGSNGRLVLTFAKPFMIERGNSRIFELYGDVGGRPADTVMFYIEDNADLYAVGGTFNVGMITAISGVDNTGYSSQTDEVHILTLQGGNVTITFVGPTSQSISNSLNDQVLWEGNLSTVNAIEIRNWRVRIQDTNATAPDLADLAASAAVQDVKIWDLDKKVVIAGPKELTVVAAGDNGNESEVLVFADSLTLDAGAKLHLGITVDVKNSPSNMTLLASLNAFGDTDIKNTTSNTYLTAATNISPATAIPGKSQTVAAASLAVAVAPSPADHTEILGGQNREMTAFNFTAGAGGKVKVNSVTVTAGTSNAADADDTYMNNGDDGVAVSSLILSAQLMDGLIPVGTAKSFSSGAATFDNLNWTLNPSETRKLSVVVSTNSAASLAGGNADYLRFSLESSSISAVNDQGNTISGSSLTGLAANSAGGASDTVVTVNSAGSLTSTLAPSSPTLGVAISGATDKTFAAFKFQATDENFLVKKVRLYPMVSGSAAATSNDLLAGLKVRYPLQNGQTGVASVGLSGAAVTVDISSTPMYVPQNGTATFEVIGDLATFTLLNGSEDKNLTFAIDADNTDSANLASGTASGTDDNAWSTANVAGNAQYVYRTMLNVAKGTGTPDNTSRTRSTSQNVASLLLSSASTSTSAVLRGSMKAPDASATGWTATGGGTAALTSSTGGVGSSQGITSGTGTANTAGTLAYDLGATTTANGYAYMSAWVKVIVSGGSPTVKLDTSADANLATPVDQSSAITADGTWQFVTVAITDGIRYAGVKYGTAGVGNTVEVVIDDLRFYNDSFTATVSGNLRATPTEALGTLVYLKDNSGTVRGYGALNNGASSAAGTVVLVAGNGTDVSSRTTFSDVEIGSAATAFDVVTDTNQILKTDTTANETLSVSFATGTPTSAGNFAWYDGSDINGSDDMAAITVASPTSTTVSFSNNY